MEGFSLAVLPDFGRMVAIFDKNGVGVPILFFPRQECASLQDKNTFSTWSEALRKSASAGPSSDNYDVVFAH
jgi:hypothetical protein